MVSGGFLILMVVGVVLSQAGNSWSDFVVDAGRGGLKVGGLRSGAG